jgi:hypothetical protein
MLRALPSTCFWIVLLPGKARLLPLAEDVLDQVGPQLGVDLAGLLLVGPFRRSYVLFRESVRPPTCQREMRLLTNKVFTMR